MFAYPLLSVYSQQGQDIWPDYFLRCGWVPNNIWSPGLNSSSSSPRPYSHDLATFVFEVHAMYSRVAHFVLKFINKVGISMSLTPNHQLSPSSPRRVSSSVDFCW